MNTGKLIVAVAVTTCAMVALGSSVAIATEFRQFKGATEFKGTQKIKLNSTGSQVVKLGGEAIVVSCSQLASEDMEPLPATIISMGTLKYEGCTYKVDGVEGKAKVTTTDCFLGFHAPASGSKGNMEISCTKGNAIVIATTASCSVTLAPQGPLAESGYFNDSPGVEAKITIASLTQENSCGVVGAASYTGTVLLAPNEAGEVLEYS
jgi:hypothetical protein